MTILLTMLPYVFAQAASGPDHVFAGLLSNPIDGNTYLAKMYEGWRGEWRFSLPYTADPGQGAFLFLYYLFLGHVARWLGLSLLAVYHAARLAGVLFLLLALQRFFAVHLPGPRSQALAFGLSALGTGLGWLAAPLGATTSDFWVAEAYPFLSAYAAPHFSLGLALLLWLLAEGGGLAAFFASAALSIVSPFGVVIAVVVLAGMAVWQAVFQAGRPGLPASLSSRSWLQLWAYRLRSPAASRLGWACLGGAPLLLYDLWVAHSNPTLAGWNAQNLTPAPPVWDLLIALSPALLLAVAGAWGVLRGGLPAGRLLLAWAGLGLLLVYLPFGLQRRFMMGLFVPLAGLAALGIEVLTSRRPWRWNTRALGLLLFSLPTGLFVLLAARQGAQTHDPLLYLTRSEAAGLAWITQNTPPRGLVLAAPETGLFIPAQTGRRVLYGHPFETVNAAGEQAAVEGYFLSGGADQALLARRGVDYVFFGPRERRLAGPTLAGTGLTLAYTSGDVTIYAVQR
ncbi:MAG TPA: hypothetical protein VF498_19335 [Anaerolineales bacterium]